MHPVHIELTPERRVACHPGEIQGHDELLECFLIVHFEARSAWKPGHDTLESFTCCVLEQVMKPVWKFGPRLELQ
jgi:hypothetical protein